MASSSSSRQQNFQVFLSFRGKDTRHNFTSHLLKALEDIGIAAFFDDKELKKGEELTPALLKAIIASKISIVILSKDYASSGSCLAELSQIMDCKRAKGQVVLPVFYHVNPSDVRKHGGSFKKSFDEHLIKKPGEIEKWKLAFTEVGKLKGWHIKGCLSDRSEPAYIKEIVEAVIEKLNSKSPSGFKDELVGIDDQKKKIISLLCIPQETTRRVGICGMGGIGKTTLAQAVYDEVSVQFDCRYFLQNVGEKFDKQGMESLRNELLSQVLKQETQVDTPFIGPTLIRDRLGTKRVLVVLDDVNDYDQIEGLGVQHFGHGSRIILTSRNKQVLKNGVDVMYEVERLNYGYSLRLFSRFAFQQDQPVADFRDLSHNFIEYAGGVPLALKVLGRALYQRPREYWKSALDKLKEYPDPKIFNLLKISFDGLDDQEQKIFLDIACFFSGENKVAVTEILNSCYRGAHCGISNLVDKFLIDENIRMHHLLQEMAWEIVRKESNDLGKRSRLWKSKDVYHVLKYNKGTESIEGISLNLSEIGVLPLCPSIFDKMINLKFLKFYYSSFIKNQEEFKLLLSDQGLNALSDELRYLHWECCPLKSFPSNFSPENLVELKLTYCDIEQLWNGDQNILNLREVHLEGCKNLVRIQNLSQAINLRNLSIYSCKRLVELPCLNHLTNLYDFCIVKCPIIKFPEISRNLGMLILSGTQIEEVPSSIGCLSNLWLLNLSDSRIQNLPTSIVKLDALNCIDLSGCSNITNFPNVPEKISQLNLRCTAIEEVPSSISRLNLLWLNMEHCESLKSILDFPVCLGRLDLQGCTSLKQVTTTGSYQCTSREFRSSQSCIIADCSDLSPDAIDNIVAYVLVRSQCRGKQLAEELAEKVNGIDNYGGVSCILSGNEVSERFENQSTNSSISVKLGSIGYGYRGRYLGFVLCFVVDIKFSYEVHCFVPCIYQLKTKCGCVHNYHSDSVMSFRMASKQLDRSKHVFMWFDPGMLHEDKQYVEASFRFYFTDTIHKNPVDYIKLEKCGVHVFYVDAKSSDDCNVRPSKRFTPAEEGVELALERSQASSGSHLSLIQDDGNGCDPDMMQPNSPVDPNWLSLKWDVNSSYVEVADLENEHADLKDVNGNFSSLDDKDEPPNSPVDPNWLSLKCDVNSSYVGVVDLENEHADLKDVNGNFSYLDDKDEPEHKRQTI